MFIETRCPKAHTAYYGVRYSPSKPSVSAIRRITAKNDPQDGNDSLSETLKRLAASDVGHRNALLSSKPLK